MKEHGKLTEPLCRWAVRKFAGEDLGEEVFWDADLANERFDGRNQPPTDESPGCITVREKSDQGADVGKKLSFEKTWSTAIFELYNITSARDFNRLDSQASCGSISKQQYAVQRTEIEARAAEKTRSFYIHVFLPWAKQHHVATDPQCWYLGTRADSEASILHGFDKTDAYWQEHEKAYDYFIARGRWRGQRPRFRLADFRRRR